jgi:uncharacterized protein
MGDMSKEPSMEDILSSIKRIIAEDGEDRAVAAPRAERRSHSSVEAARPISLSKMLEDTLPEDESDEEILELTDGLQDAGQEDDDISLTSASSVSALDDSLAEDNGFDVYVAEPAPEANPEPKPVQRKEFPSIASASAPGTVDMGASAPKASEAAVSEAILSPAIEQATKSSLAALTTALNAPVEAAPLPAGSDKTLEALVSELLRPMLKQWLDSNLPTMVESIVAKEIARITGRSL